VIQTAQCFRLLPSADFPGGVGGGMCSEEQIARFNNPEGISGLGTAHLRSQSGPTARKKTPNQDHRAADRVLAGAIETKERQVHSIWVIMRRSRLLACIAPFAHI
jgi:hypothetical protein